MQPVAAMTESCSSCRFRFSDGTCRRTAPKPHVTFLKTRDATHVVWPTVEDGDWCGEFEAVP